jgi:hypothetical protein
MQDDFNEAIERAEADLNNQTPHNTREGYAYSEIARAAFGKIKLFRSKGFSYAQICGVFVKNGLLPKNTNPYSLRAAFHRERERLKRGEELEKLFDKGDEAETKSLPVVKTDKTAQIAKVPAPKPVKPKEEGSQEVDRIREMTAVTVETAAGKITRYANGGFGF